MCLVSNTKILVKSILIPGVYRIPCFNSGCLSSADAFFRKSKLEFKRGKMARQNRDFSAFPFFPPFSHYFSPLKMARRNRDFSSFPFFPPFSHYFSPLNFRISNFVTKMLCRGECLNL